MPSVYWRESAEILAHSANLIAHRSYETHPKYKHIKQTNTTIGKHHLPTELPRLRETRPYRRLSGGHSRSAEPCHRLPDAVQQSARLDSVRELACLQNGLISLDSARDKTKQLI